MTDLPAHMRATQLDPDQRRRPAVDERWRVRDARSIVYKAISAWIDHDAASMGAALAFYTLFSIAPMLVIAVAVAGYVFGPHVAETQVLEQLSALIGDTGANTIRDIMLSAHYSDKKGFAAAVGIITLLVGATSVFGELQNSLD